ncbi:ArnT family glycosyltransferase [Flavisphingomonas formosensis]|uniref:ArnT family glycosyltransferase n=1 Tax=Flavisphingomonas formosensis TaxID=861534 RepID=UPI001E41ED90|nr:glycosyltransferase [Sphingomonas formosensis]
MTTMSEDGRPAREPAADRWLGYAIAFLLSVLAGYGVASTPGLISRWGASPLGWGLVLIWLIAAWLAFPIAERSQSKPRLIELTLVQGVARIFVAILFAGRAPAGDALYYLRLSGSVLAGRGLEVYEPYIGSTLHALYPPAYALLLAGWIGCFGSAIVSLMALNALIDAAAAFMIWRIGKLLDREGAGRAAAWLYLLWPSVLLSAPLAQKEGMCTLLVLVLAHEWLVATKRGGSTLRAALSIGVTAALLALTQPGLAPLALLFGVVLVRFVPLRRMMAVGLSALPVAILVMLPWWVRNWLVLGAFVPLTTTAPIGLWIGNNPAATGNWMAPPAALRGLPELEYGRAIGAMAKQWITTHPADFVRLTVTKFVRAMGVGQFGVSRLSGMTPAPAPRALALLFPVAQLSHIMLLASGAAAAFRTTPPVRVLLLLVLAGLLQLLLFGVWFEFAERHREFLTPLLLLTICCAFAPPRRST